MIKTRNIFILNFVFFFQRRFGFLKKPADKKSKVFENDWINGWFYDKLWSDELYSSFFQKVAEEHKRVHYIWRKSDWWKSTHAVYITLVCCKKNTTVQGQCPSGGFFQSQLFVIICALFNLRKLLHHKEIKRQKILFIYKICPFIFL